MPAVSSIIPCRSWGDALQNLLDAPLLDDGMAPDPALVSISTLRISLSLQGVLLMRYSYRLICDRDGLVIISSWYSLNL